MNKDNEILHHDIDLVSIVIPILNEEEFIKLLIWQVWLQDYRPIELIFVDGGSNDFTIELILENAGKLNCEDFNIILLHEKDFGDLKSPGNARNIGAIMARGNYVVLLDGDTVFLERTSLKKIKKKLENYYLVKVNTKIIVDTEVEFELSKIWPFTMHKYTRCGYRKEIFNKISYNPVLGYGEDGDFWFRVQKRYNTRFVLADDVTIGMHLPHTKTEYLKQTFWYAKSLPKFMRIVYDENRPRNHINRHLEYCSYGFFGPLLFLIARIQRGRNKTFFYWNFIVRRYIFIIFLIIGAYKEKTLKKCTWLLIKYLQNKVR